MDLDDGIERFIRVQQDAYPWALKEIGKEKGNTPFFCFSRGTIKLKNKSTKFKYHEILNHF